MSESPSTADKPAARAPEPSDASHLEVGTPDLVRLYLDEIGKAPLLDAATKVELASGSRPASTPATCSTPLATAGGQAARGPQRRQHRRTPRLVTDGAWPSGP